MDCCLINILNPEQIFPKPIQISKVINTDMVGMVQYNYIVITVQCGIFIYNRE